MASILSLSSLAILDIAKEIILTSLPPYDFGMVSTTQSPSDTGPLLRPWPRRVRNTAARVRVGEVRHHDSPLRHTLESEFGILGQPRCLLTMLLVPRGTCAILWLATGLKIAEPGRQPVSIVAQILHVNDCSRHLLDGRYHPIEPCTPRTEGCSLFRLVTRGSFGSMRLPVHFGAVPEQECQCSTMFVTRRRRLTVFEC